MEDLKKIKLLEMKTAMYKTKNTLAKINGRLDLR